MGKKFEPGTLDNEYEVPEGCVFIDVETSDNMEPVKDTTYEVTLTYLQVTADGRMVLHYVLANT